MYLAIRMSMALAVATCLAVVACSPDSPTGVNPHALRSVDSRGATITAQQQILADLTRNVALALGDSTLRQSLLIDLRDSRFTREHKLKLRSYVRGKGSKLLPAMARASARTTGDVLATIDAGRTLEIYMPVEAHRSSWTGGTDLIVAAALTEQSPLLAFNLSGEPVSLDVMTPPSIPTLVLNTVESDFDHPLAGTWKNRNDKHGAAIGTLAQDPQPTITRPMRSTTRSAGSGKIVTPYLVPCDVDPTQPDCEIPDTSLPPGLYLGFSHINDLGESWWRGDPEIEVHLIGPTFDPNNDGEHLSCTAATVAQPKFFDQNTNDWHQSPYGVWEGQLFSKANIDAYNGVYNKAFAIQFWEDDDESCLIKQNGLTGLRQLTYNLQTVYDATSVAIEIISNTNWLVLVGHIQSVIDRLQGDDQFLGTAIRQENVGRNYPDATHILMLGDGNGSPSENGRVFLRTVTQ